MDLPIAQAVPDYTSQLNAIAHALSQKNTAAWIPPLIGATTGTILGFFLGILAEPLKEKWLARHSRTSMQDKLYPYMAVLWRSIKILAFNIKQDGGVQTACMQPFKATMDRTDLEHFEAITDDKDLFYSLPEAAAFKELFTMAESMKATNIPLTCDQIRKILGEFLDEFDRYADSGVIDRQRIIDLARAHYQQNSQEAEILIRTRKLGQQ